MWGNDSILDTPGAFPSGRGELDEGIASPWNVKLFQTSGVGIGHIPGVLGGETALGFFLSFPGFLQHGIGIGGVLVRENPTRDGGRINGRC